MIVCCCSDSTAPSVLRAGGCVSLSVVAAVVVCVCLALIGGRYKSTDDTYEWTRICSTSPAQDSSGLAGACLGHPDCTPLECCPQCRWNPECNVAGCCPPKPDDREKWIQPIAPDVTVSPDVLEPRWQSNASLTEAIDLITVWCSFTSLDVSFYTATLSCNVAAWGRFDNRGRFAALPWPNMFQNTPQNATLSRRKVADAAEAINATLVLQIGSNAVEVENGDLPPQALEVKLSLGSWWARPRQVNVEYYPNFALPFTLAFQAWWDQGNDTQPDPSDIEPPVVVQMDFNYHPMYMIHDADCSSTAYSDANKTYLMEGFIHLSPVAMNGATSLNACMWLLAATACALTLLWCLLAKPQEYMHVDLMCFSGALLFALPTMRGLLPAIPAAGTRFDVLNVYGQLWLVTCSIALQAIKMLLAVVHGEWRASEAAKAAAQPPQPPVAAPVESVLSSWVH